MGVGHRTAILSVCVREKGALHTSWALVAGRDRHQDMEEVPWEPHSPLLKNLGQGL